MAIRRALARPALLVAVVLGLVLPDAALGASERMCRAAAPYPVEINSLVLNFKRDGAVHRRGTQIRLDVRVTRAFGQDSPLSPVTDPTPINLAFVAAKIFDTQNPKALDASGQETNSDGWVTLRFNLPQRTAPGPLRIVADARYVTVGSQTCEDPFVVEVGEGQDDRVATARR